MNTIQKDRMKSLLLKLNDTINAFYKEEGVIDCIEACGALGWLQMSLHDSAPSVYLSREEDNETAK